MVHPSLILSYCLLLSLTWDAELSKGTKKRPTVHISLHSKHLTHIHKHTHLTILKLPEKQQETVMNPLQIAVPNVDEEHYTLCLFPK